MRMCDATKRATYTYAQESKLVRIVIDNIGPEYKNCVQRILDLVKVTKLIQSSQGAGNLDINSVPDTHERSFSDDWLPTWKLLQASLISEYRLKLKTKEEHEQKKGPKDKLPVTAVKLNEIRRYACEGPHKNGDPSCKAAPFDVYYDCAPKEFKEKQEMKKPKYGGKWANAGNPPKKQKKGNEKKPCTIYNFGKGNCRNGAKCNFLHDDKPAGNGGGKVKDFTPRQEKLISSMVASAFKKTVKAVAKKKKAKQSSSNKDNDDDGSEDGDDFAEMMAACFLAPWLTPSLVTSSS
jgi:hypothetical protein